MTVRGTLLRTRRRGCGRCVAAAGDDRHRPGIRSGAGCCWGCLRRRLLAAGLRGDRPPWSRAGGGCTLASVVHCWPSRRSDPQPASHRRGASRRCSIPPVQRGAYARIGVLRRERLVRGLALGDCAAGLSVCRRRRRARHRSERSPRLLGRRRFRRASLLCLAPLVTSRWMAIPPPATVAPTITTASALMPSPAPPAVAAAAPAPTAAPPAPISASARTSGSGMTAPTASRSPVRARKISWRTAPGRWRGPMRSGRGSRRRERCEPAPRVASREGH